MSCLMIYYSSKGSSVDVALNCRNAVAKRCFVPFPCFTVEMEAYCGGS